MIRLYLCIFILHLGSVVFAQKDSSKTITLGMEFRPRFEYRDGYRQLPADSLNPAFFTSSRSRLILDFKQKRSRFHFSAQDIRIWGQNGNNPATGTFGIFETYATFGLTDSWKIKLGRQAVELDNGRLFSKANWSQPSRAHDGIRANYSRAKLDASFMIFYNQFGASNFGNFYPLNHYKYLVVQHLIYRFNDNLSLTVLNAFDGYQSPLSETTVYVRGTSGGKLKFKSNNFGAELVGYYQYGQLVSGQEISAYYLQPEINYRINKVKLRLGGEYLSGDNQQNLSLLSRSFNTLYGVAFKFMGHLNYFTSFPNDVNGGGLINPYFFIDYNMTKKLRLKLESHLFYTQTNVLNNENQVIDPYLGTEFDLKVKYTYRKTLFFDFGFSTMLPTLSMQTLKGGDYQKTPLFSFLMLTWKPNLIAH